MRDIGYYLYENVPLHTKYRWMAQAPGSAAVDPTRAMLGNTGNAYKASDGSVRDTLKALGIEWRGTAADAAGQALHRAADRGGTVGSASATGSGSVAGYGHSFEAARAKVHWEDPGTWDWWERPIDMTGLGIQALTGQKNSIMSDHFATAERNRTLDAEATRALYEHESASRAALAAFPVVDPMAAHIVEPAGAGTAAPGNTSHIGGPGGPGSNPPGVGVAQPPPFGPAPGPANLAGDPAGRSPGAVPPAQQGAPAHVGARPGPGPGLPGAPAPGGPPHITRPQVTSPPVTSPQIRSPQATSPQITSPRITSPPVTSPRPGPDTPTAYPNRVGAQQIQPGPGFDRSRVATPPPSWRDMLPPIGTTPPGRGQPPVGDSVIGGRSGPRSVGGGAEFAERMSPRSGEPTTTAAQPRTAGATPASRGTGTGIPFMGGMGAGTGSGATERKARYVIPSSEHFEVPMPPHPTGVIEADG